jgi:hypothetical protein
MNIVDNELEGNSIALTTIEDIQISDFAENCIWLIFDKEEIFLTMESVEIANQWKILLVNNTNDFKSYKENKTNILSTT